LLDLVSSANIACGFHAGDSTSMRETVRAAKLRGVAIGAHPSYPDMKGFGRRELGLSPKEIGIHVTAQVRSLKAICDAAGARLSHVKPHGALYNRAARDNTTARAVAEAVRDIDAGLVLLGLASSEMMLAASHFGIPFAAEAFADRAYAPDLTLLPRDQPDAVIDDVERAAAAALRLVERRSVMTSDGAERALEAASLCVHGDNARALAIMRAIRSRLESAGVRIQSFAS
jgi:UPF0271 protein